MSHSVAIEIIVDVSDRTKLNQIISFSKPNSAGSLRARRKQCDKIRAAGQNFQIQPCPHCVQLSLPGFTKVKQFTLVSCLKSKLMLS